MWTHTSGKWSLGSITKKGDRYVRTMLIKGARSIAIRAQKDTINIGLIENMLDYE